MTFDRHVSEMKALANQLVRYSFPMVSPEDEEEITWLKQRHLELDGYDIVIYFNKCYYPDKEITLETLQVFGKYFTFLPFALICKVARMFLGGRELSLVEVIHNKQQAQETVLDQYSRKIYVWTVYYDSAGNPIANPFVEKLKQCSYEGLEFSQVDRNRFTFF